MTNAKSPGAAKQLQDSNDEVPIAPAFLLHKGFVSISVACIIIYF